MARKSKEQKVDKEAVDEAGRITPTKAKNAVKVAKVLGPAVLPVVGPYAAQAATLARDRYDRMRARRLGVDVDSLGQFSGRGAGLHARINGTKKGLNDLAAKPDRSEGDLHFAEGAKSSTDKLAAAVRAAESMPSSRRRAAHRAVAEQLDDIEAELLRRLGVTAT